MFAFFIGVSMLYVPQDITPLKRVLSCLNHVFMAMVTLIMQLAPFGVFCMVGRLLLQTGLATVLSLGHYFLTVVVVLLCQLFLVYGCCLYIIGRPLLDFYRTMRTPMFFAFGVSSSSAAMPLVLRTVVQRLGVSDEAAALVVPLGATLNMDGTAIMQGVPPYSLPKPFM